jgi:hypothetical protein
MAGLISLRSTLLLKEGNKLILGKFNASTVIIVASAMGCRRNSSI